MKTNIKIGFILSAIILAGCQIGASAQTSSVFVTGLKEPSKIIYDKHRRFFLVAESGLATVPNSGRVSIVTDGGSRYTLIDGLPSGPAPPSGEPSGPSGLLVQGNKLYIAIGSGNSVLAGPAPGSEIPNPNPNSPILSSVLELRLPIIGFRANRANYNLNYDDHVRLAEGNTVILGHSIPRARIRLLADFPDFHAETAPRRSEQCQAVKSLWTGRCRGHSLCSGCRAKQYPNRWVGRWRDRDIDCVSGKAESERTDGSAVYRCCSGQSAAF